MPPAGPIDRIADALRRLSDVTDAVQNTSIAVTHVANHHERLADAAHVAAQHVGTLAQAGVEAAGGLVQAAGTAAEGVARMAGAAERFVALCERLEPRVVQALGRAAGEP